MKPTNKPTPLDIALKTVQTDNLADGDTGNVDVAITLPIVVPGTESPRTLIPKKSNPTPPRWSQQRVAEREKYRRERAAIKRNNYR
jgi:hypothetical protein